jgi:hypothetical protein
MQNTQKICKKYVLYAKNTKIGQRCKKYPDYLQYMQKYAFKYKRIRKEYTKYAFKYAKYAIYAKNTQTIS